MGPGLHTGEHHHELEHVDFALSGGLQQGQASGGVGSFAGSYGMAWVANHVLASVRRQMFAHALRLPASDLEREAAGLLTTDAYLAADGIENVIRVLEDLEDDKFPEVEFVELDACAGGCVGGVLQVENPYIAKAKIKKLRRYMPVSLNHLETKEVPELLNWETALEYNPVLELGKTKQESFDRYAELEDILEKLPDLDCGSCGAPTCEAFAEDVVRGDAELGDCVVLMRQKMEAILQAAGLDGKGNKID